MATNVQARSSKLDENGSPQSTQQLERTYKKALDDYQAASDKLASQMSAVGKTAAELRSRLEEKEETAARKGETLQKFLADTAKQSSFVNGKPIGDQFEELENQIKDMHEQLELERLKFTTNKVAVSQLELKQKKKTELSGGVSDIEFSNLEEATQKSNEKKARIVTELKCMDTDKEKLVKLESYLQKAIQDYTDKNQSKMDVLAELNEEIEEKRSNLEQLNKHGVKLKKQIGYDASDIGAFLQTKMVNDDFSSSQNELEKLHSKLNSLVLEHSKLTETS